MAQDSYQKLEGHDFWSNSVQALVEDDDLNQFLDDNPSQSEKLLVALNALEVTYGQIKTDHEAEGEEEDEDEDDSSEDEDEE